VRSPSMRPFFNIAACCSRCTPNRIERSMDQPTLQPVPSWPTLEDWDRFDAALFPYMVQQRYRMRTNGGKFVHYTSGEGAEGILKNRVVWLRSTTCMNDYSEAVHGYQCLRHSWHGDSGRAFQDALEKCHPGIAAEVAGLFDKQAGAILEGTFVACFSEHDPSEDMHGRLSMWRAYCNPTGVGLVLNSDPFFAKSDALKAYSSPVAYLSDADFDRLVYTLAENVERDREFLGSMNRTFMVLGLLNMMRFAILCTKHPAFLEEREWRVLYTPSLFASAHIQRSVRTIRGVPQAVYDLPLKNIPNEGLVGIEIPELLRRVIIGPTQFVSATHAAIWHLLKDAGVVDPSGCIHVSGVPLRT